MNISKDYPNKAHHLQRWFGVDEFIVISHVTDAQRMGVSEGSLLQSTIATISINIPSFTIPVFIPIYEKWSGTYIGISTSLDSSIQLRYDADIQSTKNNSFNNIHLLPKPILSIVNLYESRMDYNTTTIKYRLNTNVSVRWSYLNALNEWFTDLTILNTLNANLHQYYQNSYQNKQQSPRSIRYDNSDNNNNHINNNNNNNSNNNKNNNKLKNSSDNSKDVLLENLIYLPTQDPIETFQLTISWYDESLEHYLHKYLESEEIIINNSIKNKKDKEKSKTNWGIKCLYMDSVVCFLTESVQFLLQEIEQHNNNNNGPNSISVQQLASNTLSVTPLDMVTRSFTDLPSPHEIHLILQIIFKENKTFPFENNSKENKEKDNKKQELYYEEIKGAPINSILHQLVIYLMQYKNTKAIGILWFEFVKELRWHWENKVPIPKVDVQLEINLQSNILYQKLQMVRNLLFYIL